MNKKKSGFFNLCFLPNSSRALSTVVTTLIIILLSLVAIGIIWAIISQILSEGAGEISLKKFVRTGEAGACTKNSDCGISGWIEGSGFCNGTKLWQYKVSYSCDDGVCVATTASEFREDCDTCSEGECVGEGGSTGGECKINSDCGTDVWISGSETCSGDEVWQYKTVYTCSSGFCSEDTDLFLKKDCTDSEEICSEGECIEEVTTCEIDSDCGTDNWINEPACVGDQLWQNWKQYVCTNKECSSNVTNILKQDCVAENKICFDGSCFEVIDCVQNKDCNEGEVCIQGECVVETAVNSGAVYSTWPLGLGLYFDSPDLPKTLVDYVGYFVRFSSGEENRCLKIIEYTYPDFEEFNSRVRLDATITQIQSGDNYEIWQTLEGCQGAQ